MMRAAVDRARSTRGGMLGSSVLHVLFLILLTFTIRPEVAVELAQELTKVSYIEAHLGENLAQKVELKTLAKRTPPSIDPGRGISTRSAVKPSPAVKPADPVQPALERTLRTEVAEVAPALPKPTERPAREIEAAPRLQSRDEQIAAVELPGTRERDALSTADTKGPQLTQRSDAMPTLDAAGPELRSRDGALSVVGGDIDPLPRGSATREVADARAGAVPSGGTLQGSRPGGSYQAPGAALQSSRTPSRGIAEGGAESIAPPSGGGSESTGRRTILDYGSGGGSGGLRSRGGGVAPPPERPIESGRAAADKSLAEAAPTEISSNGTGMSITGQIAGRKIVRLAAPEYTARAKQQGWEGTVAVHFTVLPDGRVKDNARVEQMSQHRDLNQAALDAIEKFQFAPLPTGDAQVEQWGVITFVFRLK